MLLGISRELISNGWSQNGDHFSGALKKSIDLPVVSIESAAVGGSQKINLTWLTLEGEQNKSDFSSSVVSLYLSGKSHVPNGFKIYIFSEALIHTLSSCFTLESGFRSVSLAHAWSQEGKAPLVILAKSIALGDTAEPVSLHVIHT